MPTLIELADRFPSRVTVTEEAPSVSVGEGALQYTAAPVRVWTLRDAVVHRGHGAAITIDGHAVHAVGVTPRAPDVGGPVRVIERASYGAAPTSGNYCLFVFGTPVRACGLPAPVITPLAEQPYHAQWLTLTGLEAVPPHRGALHVGTLLLREPIGVSLPTKRFHPVTVGRVRGQLRARAEIAAVTPRRVYLARTDARARRLTNEPDLILALSARGFYIATMTDREPAAQLRAMAAAELVVAPHGAGLTNLLAAQHGTRVLELRPGHYPSRTFERLSQALDLRYSAIDVPVTGAATQFDPWTLDIDTVLRAIDALEETP